MTPERRAYNREQKKKWRESRKHPCACGCGTLVHRDSVWARGHFAPPTLAERYLAANAALDALVAERDALAARLAEAEQHARAESETNQWLHERVAALAEALRDLTIAAASLDRLLTDMIGTKEYPGSLTSEHVELRIAALKAETVLAAADRPTEGGEMDTTPATHDALMEAWGIIANVSEGDWTKQPQEWQDAAVRWRDETFHPAIRAAADRPEGTTGETWFAGTPPHLRPNGGSCTCGRTYRGNGTDLGRSRCPLHGREATP